MSLKRSLSILVGFIMTFSILSIPASAAVAPNAVSQFLVQNKTSTSVDFTWTTPVDNGSGISGYLVEYQPAGGTWTTFATQSASLANTITVSGLAPSTAYAFRISAVATDAITLSPPTLALYQAQVTDAGEFFSCALMVDQSVQCWGSAGEVGDGTGMQSAIPRGVLLPEKAISLSAGGTSACAVGVSGAVYCWGHGSAGQLGNGHYLNQNTPVQVVGISNAIQVAVGGVQGDGQACAVTSSHDAYCWGFNNSGQLGDGNTSNIALPIRIKLPQNIGFVKAVAGGTFTCFIGTDSHVYCTGDNTAGEIGIGSAAASVLMPTLVPNLNNITSGAAGNDWICAIDSAQNLYCWGQNGNGQLGTGDNLSRSAPAKVNVGWNAAGIGVAHGVSIAILPNGTLKQLGSDGNFLIQSTLGVGMTFSNIVGAPESICATETNGTPHCWGYGGYLGLGYTSASNGYNTPVDSYVNTFAPLVPGMVVNPLVIGKTYNSVTLQWSSPVSNGLAITDYLVEYQTAGGNWVTFSHTPTTATSIEVIGLQSNLSYEFRVSAVSSTGSASLVGPSKLAQYPASATSVGRVSACNLEVDGTVQCWGLAGYVGNGTNTDQAYPQNVLLPELATAISSGSRYSCAIGKSGSVYCWGLNVPNGNGNPATYEYSPVKVTGITNAVKISVGMGTQGDATACVITSTAQGYCWGDNSTGQIGDGTLINRSIPTLVVSSVGFTGLAVGYGYSCWIGTDGSIYCNGDDKYGQLGLGTVINPVLVPTKVTSSLPGFNSFVQVSAMWATCALNASGVLFCWGDGRNTGQGNTIDLTSPAMVNLNGIAATSITVSINITCVILADQSADCWGPDSSFFNNVGSGYSPSYVPQPVLPSTARYQAMGGKDGGICLVDVSGLTYCYGVNGEREIMNPCGCIIDAYGAIWPNLPFASTLNNPPPLITGISPVSGPVGTVVNISGNYLTVVNQVQFNGQAVPFTNASGTLQFQIPISAAVGSSYPIVVTSISGKATSSTNFQVTLSPVVSMQLSVTTNQQGTSMPVTGGQYTWLSQGRFSPSSPTYGDTTGNVTLDNVVSGPGQIILSGGQLPDGTTVSGSWNVSLASGALALHANPPTAPPLITTSANISFPDATPVPGAVLTASGLTGSYSDSSPDYALTYYLPSAITNATSDANGLAILYGYQSSPTVLGVATYNDTVLVQSTQSTSLIPNGVATPISFDYAPFLTTSTPALLATAGSVASLAFSDLNNSTPVANQTVTLTEISVTTPLAAAGIKPSSAKSAAGLNCPTTFTGITDSAGNVSIPLCTSVSGLHTYKVTSLGSISQNPTVTMNVTTSLVATTIALTGPSSGIINQKSTNFTVTPDGSYTGTITVTVTGGGMNNSIPLTFSNSAVPQTFTISPIATGTVTVSVSSSPTLTNPVNLTYTVNPTTASTYTFSGPTSGSVNALSSNFTITPNGVYSGVITVEASGGGLNTSIPLTFSNSSAAQTFSITPSAIGTVILTATSAPKLSNPASRSYSVSSAGLMPVLTVTNVGSTGFVVNVTNYNSLYKFRATSSAGFVTVGTPTSNSQAFTIGGLVAGQAATVSVTSTQVGYSSLSATISETAATVPGTPAAPTGVAGNTQVTLTIAAPASNGGSAITSYKVTQSTSATGTFAAVAAGTCTTITAAGTCTVTGLTNGTAYFFKVAAANIAGTGSASAASAAITPAAAFSVASASASPTSASVPVGYAASATRTTITLARAGGSGANPTTTITVSGGTWTVVAGVGVTGASTTISSATPLTITLTAASGTLTLSLNAGSPAATFTATIHSTTVLTYAVAV